MTVEQVVEEKEGRGITWVKIIQAVKEPISFFTLVVIVVEVILGLALTMSEGTDRTYLILGMIVLLFYLATLVAWMTRRTPEAAVDESRASTASAVAGPHDDVKIVLDPRDEGDYAELFEGFTDSDLLVYNAPFRLEKNHRVRTPAFDVHLRRYQHGVTSKYLFFEHDDYDRAKRFFSELQERALERGLSLANRVHLIYAPVEDPPAYSFFVGKRSGEPRCIFYVSSTSTDLPRAVMVVDGHESLSTSIGDHFELRWEKAKTSGTAERWMVEKGF